ncbi:MAG: hypothetical protein FWG31_05645 [Oscillospiraceae bacterium]|nr:hypothetical protein [Oscillospiraceae bacterium]
MGSLTPSVRWAGGGQEAPAASLFPSGEGWTRSGRGGSSPPKITLTINKGDTVTHKRFGKGLVLTVTPMGNDAMLEIAFDEGGTRKLMLNFAAAFLSVENIS